jgi:hypothetical protein
MGKNYGLLLVNKDRDMRKNKVKLVSHYYRLFFSRVRVADLVHLKLPIDQIARTWNLIQFDLVVGFEILLKIWNDMDSLKDRYLQQQFDKRFEREKTGFVPKLLIKLQQACFSENLYHVYVN